MRLLPLLPLLCALAAAEGPKAELVKKMQERKIERFFAHVEADRHLDPVARAKILKLREGALLGGEFCCMHQALLEMHPDYRRGDAMLLDERYAAAAEVFTALAQRDDEYLKAYATFRLGLAEMNRERYEPANAAFRKVLDEYGRHVGCDTEAAFYHAYSLSRSRRKEEAMVGAKRFLEDYPEAPQRYRQAMEQMLNELMQAWESPLYDLSDRMDEVAKKIEDGDTGSKTQGNQKEIVDIIEQLIKKAEQNEGGGQGNDGGGNGNPRGNDPSNSPANKSAAPPGAADTGDLRGKPQRKPGEQWGEMKDKEREDVLQALKEKIPDRYRDLLRQYDKALAEGKRVTTPSPEGK